MNFSDSVGIRRLHANLQLNQSRPHGPHQFNLFLCQKICRYFKMKIGNTIIMLPDILPNLHRMTVTAVKCPVHKLHLGDLVFQEKLQFLFHQLQTSEAKLFIYGRQTVTAGERTSPAAFIIYDLMLKFFHIPIDKRNSVQIHDLSPGMVLNLSLFISPGNSL